MVDETRLTKLSLKLKHPTTRLKESAFQADRRAVNSSGESMATPAPQREEDNWLMALLKSGDNDPRFPRVNLADGNPAEEFARDPEGYDRRIKETIRRWHDPLPR